MSRPKRTIDNARFGEVRADELRLRDEILTSWSPTPGLVVGLELVGDDVNVSVLVRGGSDAEEFTTSVGNGVRVVGRE